MADFYAFTDENIKNAPSEPGVYALYDGNETIYYGRHQTSIRQRLGEHKSGAAGSCTQFASQYWREVNSDPVAREMELLVAYEAKHGQLPRCNDRIG